MFCVHCSRNFSSEHQRCPDCGRPLVERSAAGNDQRRFYCRRCKRYLLSRICPIHGSETTMSTAAAEDPKNGIAGGGGQPKPLPTPGERAQGGRALAVPGAVNGSRAAQAASNGHPGATAAETEQQSPRPSGRSNFFTFADERLSFPSENNGAPAAQAAEESEETAEMLRRLIEKRFAGIAGQSDSETNGLTADRESPWQEAAGHLTGEQEAAPAPPRSSIPPHRKQGAAAGTAPYRRWLLAAIIPLLTLLVTLGAYYLYQQSLRSQLYQEAETYFDEGRFDRALPLYQRLAAEFPGHPEISAVQQRIAVIQKNNEEAQQRLQLANTFLEKAREAFRQKRYFRPEDDNVVKHLQAALTLQPALAPALDLLDALVAQLLQEAREALQAGRFEVAGDFYREVLRLRPDDPQVLSQVETDLRREQVKDMLANLRRRERSKSEIEQLQRQKYSLRAQVEEQLRKLHGAQAQRPDPLQNAPQHLLSAPAARTPKNVQKRRGTADSRPAQVPPVELLSPSSRSGISVRGHPDIVGERFLDEGKKEYLYREPLQPPSGFSASEAVVILAECTVDTSGRVEQVEIVAPAENPQLNALAAASLKKYRYKPGTYKGNAVRFKSLEVLSFQ